jgi:hypothetical protein
MKKLIIAVFITIAIAGSAFAKPENVVNYRVLNHFNANFSEAENVNWSVAPKFVKASFELDGKKMEAFYNSDGELIGTSTAFAYNKLPKKSIKEISKKYPFPPYKLKECIEFTNGEGEKSYFISFDTENENVIIQINSFGNISEMKKTAK